MSPAPTAMKGSRIAQDQISVGQDARSAAETALGQPHRRWPGVVLQSQGLPRAPNPSQGPRIHTGTPRSAEACPQTKGQSRVLGSAAEPHTCISQAGSSAEAGHLSLPRTEQWESGPRAEGRPAPGQVAASLGREPPRYTSVSSRLSAGVLNFITKKF